MPGHKVLNSILLALLVLVSSTGLYAEIYKWFDANGNTVYGNKPPQNAELQKITGAISSFSSVSVEPFEFDASLITPEQVKTKTVIMYSTSWCGYCKKAAKHFRSKGIPFKEYDIEKSKKAAKAYKKLNGRGVPLILVGKKRMSGFSTKRFDSLYYGKT
ncbi:MAG: DUF4124 domain-containing protein [Gammaproteobacteria bacterium]|nr:DUF4124 domain-containing protein [Gammaproteobacteria bacterium]